MYNKTLLDPPDGAPAWHPYKKNENGELISDPDGALIMRANAKVDLSKPAEIELWRHGDVGEGEGLNATDVWKKNKVLRSHARVRV